jgi:hypothetical protein
MRNHTKNRQQHAIPPRKGLRARVNSGKDKEAEVADGVMLREKIRHWRSRHPTATRIVWDY